VAGRLRSAAALGSSRSRRRRALRAASDIIWPRRLHLWPVRPARLGRAPSSLLLLRVLALGQSGGGEPLAVACAAWRRRGSQRRLSFASDANVAPSSSSWRRRQRRADNCPRRHARPLLQSQSLLLFLLLFLSCMNYCERDGEFRAARMAAAAPSRRAGRGSGSSCGAAALYE
jgi:hypothetical protein